MKIVVNHLTRMRAGFICVAGINLENKQHVRPVLFSSNLTTAFLAQEGGYFGLGYKLDLGPVRPTGKPPEIEDTLIEPRKIRRQGQLSPTEFWQLLKQVSRADLTEIFGPDLTQLGHSAVIKVGGGQASLGSLILSQSPRPFIANIGNRDRLRLNLANGPFKLDLSITDLRFYEPDHITLKRAVVDQVMGYCESQGEVILSVGLSRAQSKGDDDIPRHWLQVNNLHFEHHPIW
jgi:hypothetical protein